MGETIINRVFHSRVIRFHRDFNKGYLSVVTESQNLLIEISITAYPNPVLNSLTIKIVNPSDSSHWSVNVYDYKGEVVIQHETENRSHRSEF